jgi:hypothetical protein
MCREVVYSLSDVPDPRGPLTRNWHCLDYVNQHDMGDVSDGPVADLQFTIAWNVKIYNLICVCHQLFKKKTSFHN